MYVSAPRWRGTSPVFRLPSVVQVRRGLGDVAACNWTDEFGECITPGAGDTVVLGSGLRLKVGAAAVTPKPAAAAGSDLTAWVNENAGTIAVIGGAGLLLVFAAKAVR